jgi:hypothetical protein
MDLLRKTPREVIKRSHERAVAKFNPKTDIKEGVQKDIAGSPDFPYYDILYQTSGSKKAHKCSVRFYHKVNPRSTVRVDCDCKYFRFYLNYLLANSRVATWNRMKGHRSPPKETNPSGTLHLCKHLVLVGRLVPAIKIELLRRKKKAKKAPKPEYWTD